MPLVLLVCCVCVCVCVVRVFWFLCLEFEAQFWSEQKRRKSLKSKQNIKLVRHWQHLYNVYMYFVFIDNAGYTDVVKLVAFTNGLSFAKYITIEINLIYSTRV